MIGDYPHPITVQRQEIEDALDPRWQWINITTLSDATPQYVRGLCNHLETVPVESVTGETVAHLCLTCDTQLP